LASDVDLVEALGLHPYIRDRVLAEAVPLERDQSVLLTADNDFGELVFRQHRLHAGIVLPWLAGVAPAAKAQVVAAPFRRTEPDLRRSSAW
jgi:hypothetical protein